MRRDFNGLASADAPAIRARYQKQVWVVDATDLMAKCPMHYAERAQPTSGVLTPKF